MGNRSLGRLQWGGAKVTVTSHSEGPFWGLGSRLRAEGRMCKSYICTRTQGERAGMQTLHVWGHRQRKRWKDPLNSLGRCLWGQVECGENSSVLSNIITHAWGWRWPEGAGEANKSASRGFAGDGHSSVPHLAETSPHGVPPANTGRVSPALYPLLKNCDGLTSAVCHLANVPVFSVSSLLSSFFWKRSSGTLILPCHPSCDLMAHVDMACDSFPTFPRHFYLKMTVSNRNFITKDKNIK